MTLRSRRPLGALVATAALLAATGCNILGPLGYLFAPPQIKKADFKLTKGRLLVLVEYARPEDENPVFTQAFRERLAELLRERKVNDQLVPYAEFARMQQEREDFDQWSVQRVGRALQAEQVLYVRVTRLTLRPAPDYPLLEPEVRLALKVIGMSDDPKAARLWPPGSEREGHTLERARPPQEAMDARGLDAETRKLARDAAQLVVMPFYDVDTEEPVGWEP